MRICLDARPVRGVTTGLGRYALNLLRHLALIDRENEYLVLRRPTVPGPLVVQENFREISVAYGIFSPHNILAGAALINPLRADIYHTLYHFLPLGVRARQVVCTLHDLIWVEHPALASASRWYRWWKHTLVRPLAAHALHRADHLIASSEFTRQRTLAYYNLPAAKLSMVHLGVDPAFLQDEPAAALPPDCQGREFIFTLGNTLPYKNTHRLISAFAALAARYPRVCLLVAGRGDDFATLSQLSRQLGIADQVVFARQLSDSQIRGCFAKALFFAFPSLIEGFGLPLVEAMASGCPVLTSAVSSLAEVAGEAALLVDPNSVESMAAGIASLLDNGALRQELARKGRQRAAHFSWQACAAQTLAIYQQLAGSPPGPAPQSGHSTNSGAAL